jgi:hypothetical protein
MLAPHAAARSKPVEVHAQGDDCNLVRRYAQKRDGISLGVRADSDDVVGARKFAVVVHPPAQIAQSSGQTGVAKALFEGSALVERCHGTSVRDPDQPVEVGSVKDDRTGCAKGVPQKHLVVEPVHLSRSVAARSHDCTLTYGRGQKLEMPAHSDKPEIIGCESQ